MQILAAGRGGDIPGLGADIIDDGLLQPRNEEMGALIHDRLLDSTQTIEDDSTSTTFDIIDGSLDKGETDGGGDGEFVKRRKSVGHDSGWRRRARKRESEHGDE